ncbi:unnamed protein product [Allacma fusca]|uniref:Uncharacterized protein n=1 Tax=Allacma fusca TaxID=39272 RepID=A0A8J2K4G0_9HEXA|nr:unnamed protein product [Allacma fusca]
MGRWRQPDAANIFDYPYERHLVLRYMPQAQLQRIAAVSTGFQYEVRSLLRWVQIGLDLFLQLSWKQLGERFPRMENLTLVTEKSSDADFMYSHSLRECYSDDVAAAKAKLRSSEALTFCPSLREVSVIYGSLRDGIDL